MERTSHSVWVNSKALELAGINKDTKDAQGGRIIRDQKQENRLVFFMIQLEIS